jgi:hypothetical protein
MSDDEYEVGYGKPPKRTRFKKGQSGNPNGRPKGRKSIPSIIEEVFREKVKVKAKDGSHYYISKLEAVLTQLTNQAAGGDTKAARTLFHILNMFPELKEPAPVQAPKLHIHFVDPPTRKNGEEEVEKPPEKRRKITSD